MTDILCEVLRLCRRRYSSFPVRRCSGWRPVSGASSSSTFYVLEHPSESLLKIFMPAHMRRASLLLLDFLLAAQRQLVQLVPAAVLFLEIAAPAAFHVLILPADRTKSFAVAAAYEILWKSD